MSFGISGHALPFAALSPFRPFAISSLFSFAKNPFALLQRNASPERANDQNANKAAIAQVWVEGAGLPRAAPVRVLPFRHPKP